MAEYIEREARLREIDKAFEEYGQNGDILKLFSECRASILFAPTADAVEVRHGKWYKGDMPTYGGYKCSVCELNTVEYNKPYCPNCGAKMDGKGEG
jgi:rubrerythrin